MTVRTGRCRASTIAAVVGLGCVVGAGCRIPSDARPRDVAADDRVEFVQVNDARIAASGTSRIFLLGPALPGRSRQLQAVQRDVDVRPAPLLEALFGGPSASELDSGVATAIPSDTTLLSARAVSGVLTLDLSPEILELSGDTLLFAVAQIVFTASQIDGIDGVRIRVDGQNRAWPTGTGVLLDGPLTVYDYAGYVETSQPDYPPIPSGESA